MLRIPEGIQWGSYSLDFPTHSNEGIEELRKFMRELDKNAKWAESRADIIGKAMRELNQSKRPLEMVALVPSVFPTSDGDVILLENSQALSHWLDKKFDRPLLHKARSPDTSLCGRKLNMDMFWAHLQEQPEKAIDVYDYSVVDPSLRTRTMTVQDILQHWKLPERDRHALNLLDIENRIGDFCPTEIIACDLYEKLTRRALDSVGRTDSDWRTSRQEFFILSGKNAISSIHVDTGGQLTWILILQGRKIWYFPRKLSFGAVRLLAAAGSQHTEGYEDGWARVELCPGDLFIMPPSCPHGVFTPEDCLAVGGHFYTPAQLASTLYGLKLQEDYPDICNEDLQSDLYNILETIIGRFDAVSTPTQQADVLSSSSLFLDDLDTFSVAALTKVIKTKALSRGANENFSRVIKQLELRANNTSYLMAERTSFIKALGYLRQKILKSEAE
ncbi:hypothetical protein CBS147321_1048 [Aspergillus niger]|nr:hypothetical protein CBS133816_8562 [Aspergillus niger]KAI2943084.1 hypothetical protein CBS147322_8615 [Aspergillus niger]KAI2951636.1 hypothetical protein CBS147321_1048 [Aspergillus niger]KAI2963461.1 hypothetical protein CBS147324_8955 [Aspergillus niger]KAI3025064.1 hypothetical protein CBS147347_5851 [Aspergillus niger]